MPGLGTGVADPPAVEGAVIGLGTGVAEPPAVEGAVIDRTRGVWPILARRRASTMAENCA